MSAFGRTRPDERYKKEQCFRCPERACISWGRAMQGRGPGEGPNLIALGAVHRCALPMQVQSGECRSAQAVPSPFSCHDFRLLMVPDLTLGSALGHRGNRGSDPTSALRVATPRGGSPQAGIIGPARRPSPRTDHTVFRLGTKLIDWAAVKAGAKVGITYHLDGRSPEADEVAIGG